MRAALLAVLLGLLPALALAQAPGRYAIATAHPLATAAGEETLRTGGNAFDAAVAVTAALAVVEPAGSGLGGGGFYLLHLADSGRKVFVDAREVAPLAATADMYLDATGQVNQQQLAAGPLAAGIPGIPAALDHLSREYGRIKLELSLAPALRHAREGIAVDHKLAAHIQRRAGDLKRFPASAALFLPQGMPLAAGQTLRQPELAATLERMQLFGAAGFYQGRVADELVAAVQAGGGIWTLKDLASYRVKERAPVILDYRGWQLVTAPPPSSGGLVLGLMTNILSGFTAPQSELNALHLRIEAMRRAYFDRARFMGDTDFVEVPSRALLSAGYAEAWRKTIDQDKASRSADFNMPHQEGQGRNTTHFSIIDAQGNRVAATLSINYMLGSAFVAAGTGVLLNNEMDDFVAKPGEPNAYGLVGGQANAIEPGKRMLSSMSPTFLEGADRIAVLGTPGGSRIITMVFHAIEAVMAGEDAKAVVSRPRYHHQYLPDVVQFEPEALSPYIQRQLSQRGHVLQELGYRYGNMQAIIWDLKQNRLEAASDPRGIGSAVLGPARARP